MLSWMNDSWLALEGFSVERFPFRMSPIVNIKSFAVDKLLAAAEAADRGGSGD